MVTKNIKEKIKEYFFVNPSEKKRLRELERELNLSFPSVRRYCKELVEEKILSIEKIGDIIFYCVDKTNKEYLLDKKLNNIKKIIESGLIDYLKKELSNPPIIVFGSYSKGEDIEDSDIDLYVETSSKKKFTLDKYEKILNRKIQLFIHKNIKEVNNPHLSNNILNGITLNGNVEVFK